MIRSKVIAIRDGANKSVVAVARVLSTSEGGLAVLTPYHSGRDGYLCRLQVSTKPGHKKVPRAAKEDEFSASDLVKLTVHADGTVHFSTGGKTPIRSGKNEDGSFKGMGVRVTPIAQMVSEDQPALSVTAWGLDDFKNVPTKELAAGEHLVFTEASLFDQHSSERTPGAYRLELFLLPPSLRVHVKGDADGQWMDHCLRNYVHDPGVLVRLGIIDLGSKDFLLGVLASRVTHGFEGPSGSVLGSPSCVIGKDGAFDVVETIYAICPASIAWPAETSLDYRADEEKPSDPAK